ncbi:RNA 2',3'-cyclic phosphodiesterase [Pseudomonas luteola]|uniref:RNA 2',3'-cyclic phosphodiesterase n=1 Tax=Pseudomonas luteola TaxID=47886 RepID=UPI003DA0136C
MRMFFALPCPASVVARVVAWRKEQGMDGRLVPPENLHMTLAFLGEILEEQIDALMALGDHIPFEPCTVVLDRVERWHQGLISMIASQTPVPLVSLVDDLNLGLKSLGVPLDRRPFVPHLTAARKSRYRPNGLLSLAWPVERFALFVSESSQGSVQYRALKEWTVAEGSPGE